MVNAIISEHKDALLMQRMESITDVFFPAISLVT
jgi:hypothetical protein